MRLQSDLIVMDLEANQPSGRIIEIGAVYINRELCNINDTFQAYVNPFEPVSDYIKNLCNLETENLNRISSASSLEQVNIEFYAWATQKTKNVILASWGNYDVAELHKQDSKCQFRKKSIDIKSIAQWECARHRIKTENSLSASCQALGVKVILPAHRALPDAETTANLLIALAKKHNNIANELNNIYPVRN